MALFGSEIDSALVPASRVVEMFVPDTNWHEATRLGAGSLLMQIAGSGASELGSKHSRSQSTPQAIDLGAF